ncbi:tRNA (adenosine(37)-N6)-threonylcarbamoyltransferase complex dimerization subunit type 1 TsaB [Paenibacillus sp. CN-4]|uniref:tRNA (adenosine(37)-N6)-threonylcarbamoyltransferase complex dimerization subunit type 1 TsaB n=1 Tax=Paenibacillus nanchangensis TaxID=3348343 RepID=UPI00397BFD96
MTNDRKEPRKRFLALDTATSVLGVAVTEDGAVLSEINATGERNHSVHLLPIVERAFKESGTEAAALAGIAVGVGPGSYTGTRIAVTAAKSLAWAWKLPLAGLSSLQALAWGGWAAGMREDGGAGEDRAAAGDWIVPLLDARRGQVYTALFAARSEGSPLRLAPDAIRLMNGWADELASLLSQAAAGGETPGRIWFVGETRNHGETAEARLSSLTAARVRIFPYELEGRWVGLLGEEHFFAEGGEIRPDTVHALVPNYTQLSEAEAKLRAGEGGAGV